MFIYIGSFDKGYMDVCGCVDSFSEYRSLCHFEAIRVKMTGKKREKERERDCQHVCTNSS